MRGFVPPSGDEERLFVRRAEEMAAQVRFGAPVRTTAFCNERQQQLAECAMARAGWVDYCFAGGYPGAERKVLCIYNKTWQEADLPLCALHIEAKGGTPGHRDYLGAMLALGIKREWIGDIVCREASATAFVLQSVAGLLQDQLLEVGRCRVQVTPLENSDALLPQQPQGELRTVTVSSLRLDALLAAMLRISRGEAARLIQRKAVQVNHVETDNVHYAVYENDVFTIRGCGKFKLCSVGDKSKKDRTFVSFRQY